MVKGRRFFSLIAVAIAGLAKAFANLILPKRVNFLHSELRKLRPLLHSTPIERQFILALVAGEDHRFFFHRGIDPIGVVRAIVRTCMGYVQGGSTVEQQLVRTITGDYRRCIWRKASEMMLAATVRQVYTKNEIAHAYLAIAYFGSGLNGINAALRKLDLDSPCIASVLIAHLKYPVPASSKDKFFDRRQARICYITARTDRLTLWVPGSSGSSRAAIPLRNPTPSIADLTFQGAECQDASHHQRS